MPDIHQFRHHAMATHFEVRIAGQERTYAAQAAQAAFDLVDRLEARLSRFRADSDIARCSELAVGQTMRLSEPAFSCLELAQEMELATRGAFCATSTALRTQDVLPQWTLLPEEQSIRCERGRLEFDLGAIGKGFALDRVAELLRGWECPSFLLVAGGSSILAGEAPAGVRGWSCGLGEDDSNQRLLLNGCSLSGSGLAVKGEHIVDPRTASPAIRQGRTWALANTAAESDALSTACMVLAESELREVLAGQPTWLTFLDCDGDIQVMGARPRPPDDSSK